MNCKKAVSLPLLLLFISLSAGNLLRGQNKYALIIAIGDYKFWPKISSANDVPNIKAALLKQGFAENNISIVADAKATVAGIEDGFKQLTAKANKGDIVFIHVSSHGEQVEDNNKDETDGLDETIVSYDAAKPGNMANYAKDQLKYFRDDQFGMYLGQLRSKLGKDGDIVVVLDACHSGSGTRGRHKVRGDQQPLVSKTFKAKPKQGQPAPELFQEGNAAAGNDLSSYVIISAALAEEKNTESVYEDGKEGGSLSIAVSKLLQSPEPGTTYRSLFARILAVLNEIVPDQHPVIEGDGIDRMLFGGKFVEQKPFIEISELNGKQITIKGGIASGLDVGATVGVYAPGTTDPAKATPITTGTVTAAGSFNATVLLERDPGLMQPAEGWVFVKAPVYRVQPLVLQVKTVTRAEPGAGFSMQEESALRNTLSAMPAVQFDGNADLVLLKGNGKDSLKIAGNGYVFSTVNSGDEEELKKQLQQYAQYRFLQKLEMKDPDANLEVKLVPVINGKPDLSALPKRTTNGILDCTVGDKVVVWVKNRGFERLYLNILDLQPDGIINPIFPNTLTVPKITAEELKIEPGEEKIFSNFGINIGPPTGLEIFKVFVSTTPINMEKIAKRDVKSRGNFSALEKIFDQSCDITSRGNIEAGQAGGSVYNILFRIKPAVKQ